MTQGNCHLPIESVAVAGWPWFRRGHDVVTNADGSDRRRVYRLSTRAATAAFVRRDRVIAQLEPATGASGADVKALLQRHRTDRAGVAENDALRDGLTVEERF